MNQSSVHMQAPNPMKKKALATVIAVMIGHMGALWALGHMKTPEIKKIEKEPLQVRMVKIQEKPPEPPKPKVEPPKPPSPPKEVKEVKIVEKPITPPPPKKVEKVEQVKKPDAPKPVAKPVEAKPTPAPTPVIAAPVVEAPAPVVAPTPPAPPAPPVTKSVSIGGSGVQWSRSPKPSYSNKDLEGEARRIVVLIEADATGKIISARVTKSSGVAALDEKILRAVRSSKFKPYKENGVAYPIRAEQPFELTLNPNG